MAAAHHHCPELPPRVPRANTDLDEVAIITIRTRYFMRRMLQPFVGVKRQVRVPERVPSPTRPAHPLCGARPRPRLAATGSFRGRTTSGVSAHTSWRVRAD